MIGLAGEFRVDSVLCAFEEALGHKRRLTDEERVLLSLMELDREVMNGAFLFFFHNSSRRHAPVIVENFHRVGAHKTARLAAKALVSRRDPAAVKTLDRQYVKGYETEG
ncbi:MAG: DUF4375 domain-containing protein [Bryobacteraceae bacterium]